MSAEIIAGLAVLILVWSSLSSWLSRREITAPMAFLGVGLLLALTGLVQLPTDASTLRVIAEAVLAVVLFHDASTVNIRGLRHDWQISARLLLIGMPLTVLALFGFSLWLLPSVGVAGALLIAGALAPTDAGLGAPTVLDHRIPVRVRRALNVESGFNDGLATPIVLVALGMLVDSQEVPGGLEVARSIGLATVVGIVLGAAAARLLDVSWRRNWSVARARAIGVLAVPVACIALAEVLQINAFIAAFAGGLALSAASDCVSDEQAVNDLAENLADIGGMAIWFLAGGLTVNVLAGGTPWQWWAVALAALTVLRILPVAICLVGSGFRLPTVAFLGWFGPRGLATLIFALIALETVPDQALINNLTGPLALTVLLSVLAHGASARPLASRYAEWASAAVRPIEHRPSQEPMPSRGRHFHLTADDACHAPGPER